MEEGKLLFDAKKFGEAIRKFEEAIATDNRNREAEDWLRRAKAELKTPRGRVAALSSCGCCCRGGC